MAVAGEYRRGSCGCLPGLVRRGGKAASHGYFMHYRSLKAAGHEHEPEPRLYSSATWAIGATGRVRLTKCGAPAAVRAGERAPQPLSYCLPHPVKEERCPCDPDEVIRSRSGRPRLSHRPRRPSGHRRRGPWGQGRGCTSFRALPIRWGYAEKVYESQVFSAEIGLFERGSYGWWRASLRSTARRR